MAFTPTGPRPRRGVRLSSALVLGGFLLASCQGSGFDFVGSPDRKAFFKVPLGWREFTKRDLLAAAGQDATEATGQALPWLVGFDADPKPSADHVLALGTAPDHPVVMAQALALDFASRDQISLSAIRNQVYPVDELLNNDAAEIREYEELSPGEGLRGIRIEYDIHPGGISTVSPGNEVIRVLQIGILDPPTENLYLFAVRCEVRCFEEHQKLLEQVADSWTVKER